MANTRDTGYLRNLVAYDAQGNITLPANLTVTGTITGYVTNSALTTALAGYVPTTRTITINGTSYDLSANRSWSITSMIYPAAGIAVSTGTAWGTSITDNSTNWNTAYGWGNHASAGYLTTATAATTYVSLTGSYANPTWITSLAYSKITGVPAFLTSYTETDTLASVTGRGASTSTRTSFVEVGVTKAGSDTVAVGPWFRWTNVAEDRQMLAQLNASNGLTYWSYNGTAWASVMTLTQTGAGSFAGNLTANGVVLGTDVTYGNPYRVVAFGNTGDGNNRILAANNTSDGMYFMAATGTGFNFRPNGGTTNLVSISSTGATTFSSTVAVNTTSPYDTTQFSLDVNGGLLVKNTGKTAQFVLINANPAAGGNAGFVIHTVGGTTTSSYVDIQGYYGANVTGSTVIRLNNLGGNVLVGSLAGTGTRMVVADASGVLSTQAIPSGAAGVTSFNTRTGAVTLSSADVTGALGFTPYNATNPNGYITGYTETDTLASVTARGASTSSTISAANFQNAYQALNLDSIKTPGLYHYDGAYAGTQPLGNSWYNLRTIEIGNSGRYSQFAMPYNVDRIFYRRQADAGWQGYVELIHSGNYTSYSPSLTGSGASGTWSINVTGSAGSISGYNNPTTAATANTIVYRDGNGHISGNYILGSYFNSSAGNSENPTIGQIWTQSTGDNYLRKSTPAHFISQLGLITTSSIGSQSVNYAAYSGYSNMNPLMSIRDFTSGTLVQTNINYAVSSGDPFILEIRGNSYGNGMPWDIQVQGYIYADTIINSGGYSNGSSISGLRAINYGGNLCFWWPRQGYWHGFTVRVYTAYDGHQVNKVTSISDSSQPTTAKQYDFTLAQSLRTDNAPYAWNMNQYVRTTDNVSFARVDATNYGVGNAIYFNGGNNYLNWSGGIHTNVAFTSDTYVYASGSIRLGDMWSGGGLYRPSGNMVFGIENSDWIFSKGAVTQAYFAGGDGNLWMRWAGDWLSNLLGAKQNASTAITTSNIGSQSVSSASYASRANYLDPNYVGGVQSNPQVYFNNGIGLKAAMTGSWSTWSDTLWINGYTGGDVPWMCALHFLRNSQPRMAISAQTHGSTSYGTYYEVITGWNIGSQSVSYASSAGSASNVTHYASRGDSAWYNVVWASGNPSYMYSSDAVMIRSSDGSLRANMFYDNQNTGYYLDLNGYSYVYSMESATSMTASDWYARGGWFRNDNVNTGLYNQEVGNHWYATSSGQWNIGGTNNSWCSIAFRPQGHQSQIRGSVYADTGNNIGFLNSGGNWNLRVNNDGNIYTDLNYGVGIVSVYSSTRLQGVWSMGDAYKIAVDGTNAGNLYGLAWSHPNAGGQAGYLTNHGLIMMMYGTAFATLSDTIWCRGDITAYSDARVKDNIQVIDNALERVQAIRGVTYTRTDILDTEKRHAGVIAQEVLEVLPEVISQNSDNGHYSVSYGNMVGLLIEAIKEQQGQIEDLKQQIQYLVENR